MKNIKADIVTIPGWSEHLQTLEKLNGSGEAYAYVPLVYRALNLRCNAITGIPFRLMYGKTEKVWDEVFQTPLKTLIWKTEASKLLCGASYWLKQDQGTKRYGAQWLNPFTVKVEVKQTKTDNGIEIKKIFTQRVGSQTFGPWTAEEVVHFMEFNPMNDVAKGLGAASVALGSSKLMYYMRSFASQFFENGAMPITVLGVDVNAGSDDIERAKNFFERMTVGIKKAFGVIALRGDLKASTITPPINTLAMPEIRSQMMQDVAWAFGIPETMLTDAANYATAAEHRRSFYEETIIPSAEVITDTINKQFLMQTGMILEVHPEELDIFQEDENSRSASLLNLIDAGVPLEAAFEILGFEVSDEAMAMIRNANKPIEVVPEEPESTTQMRDEMRKWKRKSIKQFERSNNAVVEFQSDVISEKDMKRVNRLLKECKSKEDIERVFRDNHASLDDLVKSLQDATLALIDG